MRRTRRAVDVSGSPTQAACDNRHPDVEDSRPTGRLIVRKKRQVWARGPVKTSPIDSDLAPGVNPSSLRYVCQGRDNSTRKENQQNVKIPATPTPGSAWGSVGRLAKHGGYCASKTLAPIGVARR